MSAGYAKNLLEKCALLLLLLLLLRVVCLNLVLGLSLCTLFFGNVCFDI
jgi:hypothetical protein